MLGGVELYRNRVAYVFMCTIVNSVFPLQTLMQIKFCLTEKIDEGFLKVEEIGILVYFLYCIQSFTYCSS